jgi:hypothetical protein
VIFALWVIMQHNNPEQQRPQLQHAKNLTPCKTNCVACFNNELCFMHSSMQCHVLPGQGIKKKLLLQRTELEGKN